MLRRLGGCRSMRSPSRKIPPSVGVSNPAMQRNVVVLPQPLGPSSETNSPAATLKERGPTIMGTRHMVAACQYLAAEAGFRVLEAGGNAIDAGVAAGIALGVVQPEYVNFAGVAPIIIYSAKENRVITISGLGGWPKALERDFFQKQHGGKIPKGVLRTVVPAARDP